MARLLSLKKGKYMVIQDSATLEEKQAASGAQERMRLSALHASGILDTPREPEFDHIVELAAAICGTPISLCTLIDEDRAWLKAATGIEISQIDRNLSFCSETIRQTDLMIVEDLTADKRFCTHPWVTGDPALRFYAGMPLSDPDGYNLGSLCIADTATRILSDEQKVALRTLANQLKALIELRIERQRREQALAEKEQLVHALQSSEQRFRSFMNNGPFLSYIRDEDGRFVFYNKPLSDKFLMGGKEWIGKTLRDLFPPHLAESYCRSDQEALRSGAAVDAVEETQDEHGQSTFWRSSKFTFLNEQGRPMVGGISVDITSEMNRHSELERRSLLLERFALTDSLTGLANRRATDEQLTAEIAGACQTGSSLSVILLDIDNFKLRNDRYGHNAGDAVLRRMGAVLSRTVRGLDMAARYGGEEFLVILPKAPSREAMLVANRIQKIIRSEPWQDATVTVSMGVATLSSAAHDVASLVAEADAAMYKAKQSGKDRIALAGEHAATSA